MTSGSTPALRRGESTWWKYGRGRERTTMQGYLDFTIYPNVPGSMPRDTSEAAAESIRESAETLRAKALDAIRRQPATADEVADRIGSSILAVRPRVTELAKMGRIEDSGERRKNASGRSAIVWRIAN